MHVRLAHLHSRDNQREKAALHLTQALLLNPRVPLWPVDPDAGRRGRIAAGAGDWPRAVRLRRLAAHQPGAPPEVWPELLMAQLAAGDHDGARKTAAEWLPKADKPDLDQAGVMAYWLQCVPLGAVEGDRLAGVTGGLLAANRTASTLHDHGAALYRSGRYDEAHRLLVGSTHATGKGGFVNTWLFLAMTQKRRGRHDEAIRLLTRFESWHQEQKFVDWKQRISWQSLLTEARQLINAPPPMPRAAD